MNDMDIAKIIMALYKPNEMKHFGRYVKNFSQTLWDQHCMEIVEKGNIAKVLILASIDLYAQYTCIRNVLNGKK